MTGWAWQQAGDSSLPIFTEIRDAYFRIGPIAPHVDRKEKGTQATPPPPLGPGFFRAPTYDGDSTTDPLGYLMAHPEKLPGRR